ncbi:MAG: aminotransferase class I/II-fold pyridoxal phosphate-dependent enzyme, partial [Muribaculaceae bacterium]|nr:aminotransferase class I/II-fold pyridoxal phosphate-dependent enzyme [Muribaculaceae bacterium]
PNVALVAKYQTWMDGTMVRIDEDCKIINFIPKKAFKYSETEFYYKTVNVYKFSSEFVRDHYLPFLEAYIKVLGQNEYYEQVLRVITLIDVADMRALPIGHLKWYEIDDVQDLRIAETIFADPRERLKKMQHSYGGYWRYADVLDFCYLVNPYFPQPKMIDEMKANFETLLRNYPSGMGVNSLLAAKYFGLRHDLVVVGNGAAELIKSLMEHISGSVGVIFPTFEEYPNRLDADNVVKFHPRNPDFSYSADDLIEFFSANPVDTLLIVNPDNPSGNLIDLEGLVRLASWAQECNIRLVVDESFVDFSDCGVSMSLLKSEILERFPQLCVMKSISKSYGVPGLRLGVLASADSDLISRIRRDVSIWNINSFAEFYMQIFNKYEKDYQHSCVLFREEREIFARELASIPFLRVIPSQANYFLCELNGISSEELTLRLMTDHNILIKDCSAKKGFPEDRQYVRIAIRDRHDNSRLVQALKSIL